MTYYMFWGKASSYANFPIRLNISKGPTIRGLSFPFSPNLIHPFQGNTYNNTRSPTFYSLSFRVKSTYFVFPSWATTSRPLIKIYYILDPLDYCGSEHLALYNFILT